MKPLSLILCTLVLLIVSTSLSAQEEKEEDKLKLRGYLEVFFQVQDRADENYWAFEYPLYGNLGVFYPGDGFEAAVSIDLIEGLFLGETYILGGRDYSYLKLGYNTETWREGYSWSVINILNRRDDRYPLNVFYRNVLRPNPMVSVSFGGSGWAQQILASQKGDSERVEDALLGARSLLFKGGFETALGIIRSAGYPPPLLFLTLRNEEVRTEVWAELGWWVYRDVPDTVNGVLGAKQNFTSAFVVAEFVVDESSLLLYLEELTQINRFVSLGFQSYLYFNWFSAAFKSYVSTTVAELIVVELGSMFYFGKEGTFFSRYSEYEDNDNQFYLRLFFSF